MKIPDWLKLELYTNHRDIEIKWMDYGERKVFVLPLAGDAFWRMPIRKLGGAVMYRRHITYSTDMKWKLHPRTYLPTSDLVTNGRWVVFQVNKKTGDIVKLFDVVNDDGSFHPLDRRVIDAIKVRDGLHGAAERAINDVDEAQDRAEADADYAATEAIGDLPNMMYREINKKSSPASDAPEVSEDNEMVS